VADLAHIERASELPRLVRLCAARTATELNVTNLASEFGVPGPLGPRIAAVPVSALWTEPRPGGS
jgi:predicted AAA+ superfamily ATPase